LLVVGFVFSYFYILHSIIFVGLVVSGSAVTAERKDSSLKLSVALSVEHSVQHCSLALNYDRRECRGCTVGVKFQHTVPKLKALFIVFRFISFRLQKFCNMLKPLMTCSDDKVIISLCQGDVEQSLICCYSNSEYCSRLIKISVWLGMI